ncbi:putative 4-alpha-methylsterol monooxygenase [Dioscorea sansibarensis]
MLPTRLSWRRRRLSGWNLTAGETLWFHYTITVPEYYIYYLTIVFLFTVFAFLPLPLIDVELCFPSILSGFKIQPKTHLAFSSILLCYFSIIHILILRVGPLQLFSYPSSKYIFGLYLYKKKMKWVITLNDKWVDLGLNSWIVSIDTLLSVL